MYKLQNAIHLNPEHHIIWNISYKKHYELIEGLQNKYIAEAAHEPKQHVGIEWIVHS